MKNMTKTTTYVLIPGMCHGAWCFDELTASLRSAGHHVLAITLTGVAERSHLMPGAVNLDTHITDVLSAIENDTAAGDELVLVGHSYGGMVITGVADRIPGRVESLVFLDAVVPYDGEACWDLVNDEERQWYVKVDDTGFGVPPMPFFDDRATVAPARHGAAAVAPAGRPEQIPPSASSSTRWTGPASHRCGRPMTGSAPIRPGSPTSSTASTT